MDTNHPIVRKSKDEPSPKREKKPLAPEKQERNGYREISANCNFAWDNTWEKITERCILLYTPYKTDIVRLLTRE
jgi:hypothetical protein